MSVFSRVFSLGRRGGCWHKSVSSSSHKPSFLTFSPTITSSSPGSHVPSCRPIPTSYPQTNISIRQLYGCGSRQSFIKRGSPSSSLSGYRALSTEVESVEQFRQKIKANSDKLTVVQYSASWCGPCRQMKPIITKWSSDMPSVEFVSVDIDEQSVLAEEENIQHVPTFVLMKDGQAIEKLVGADTAKLKEAIDKHSSSP
eukprot:GHVQ01042990.1.p1 GENE.GHVQ01042990.1~~GHVQ01042990.1.p1  ORF type:complete len:199 (-),score=37.29 GHVQ01042990.1:427-1023(-)